MREAIRDAAGDPSAFPEALMNRSGFDPSSLAAMARGVGTPSQAAALPKRDKEHWGVIVEEEREVRLVHPKMWV